MVRTLLALLLMLPLAGNAQDVIKMVVGESELDQRFSFKREVLEAALEATRASYGDYDLQINKTYMNAKRALYELTLARSLNVYFALTQDKWEQATIPIRIPVRRGLVSYRLLVIHENARELFEKVETIDDLKKLRAGLNDGWTTYDIMKAQDFNIVKLGSYNGMFNMLSLRRYDYLLRGVNEVYGDMEARTSHKNNLIIEPRLAIFIPTVTYLFVSKKEPRLAKRLTEGLQSMVDDGSLERLVNKHYAVSIAKAELEKRKILYIPHPDSPASIPWNNKKLWIPLLNMDNNRVIQPAFKK